MRGSTIKKIQAPVQEQLTSFQKKFREQLRGDGKLLNLVTSYLYRRKGKQIRPLLVLLSASLVGRIQESTYRGASLIELLHTATLIHDDVVDDTYERRGVFSVNALWKNKVSVLVGDFLLSKGLSLCLQHDEFGHLRYISDAVREMSEGEILQLETSRSRKFSEESYLAISRKKTASLLKACCQIGVSSAGGSEDQTRQMGNFGLNLGIAFQIRDDLLDYENHPMGKPRGNDVRDGKITLPLIHSLAQAGKQESSKIKKLLKSRRLKSAQVNGVIDFARQNGGLDYARKVMEKYYEEALGIAGRFPDSEYKQALEQLAAFTTQRVI